MIITVISALKDWRVILTVSSEGPSLGGVVGLRLAKEEMFLRRPEDEKRRQAGELLREVFQADTVASAKALWWEGPCIFRHLIKD